MILNPTLVGAGGTDTSDATAGAADILSGKTAYGPNGKITGNMPSVVVPTPGITVSSNGLITASVNQSAGHTSGGNKSATKQLTTQGGKTVTPGTSQQTAVYSGRYTTGNVYVAGDADLKPENIKSGVNIFGVAGTLTSGPTMFGSRTKYPSKSSGYFINFDGLPTGYRPRVLALTLAYSASNGTSGNGRFDVLMTDQVLSAAFFWDGTDYVCRSLIAVDASNTLYWSNLANGLSVNYNTASGFCQISGGNTWIFDSRSYSLAYATEG